MFKLPLETISSGTIFTVKTHPSSKIYIVHKNDSGWIDASFNNGHYGKEWKEMPGEVTTKSAGLIINTTHNLSKIWYKTAGPGTSTELPKVSESKAVIAIFVVEGKRQTP